MNRQIPFKKEQRQMHYDQAFEEQSVKAHITSIQDTNQQVVQGIQHNSQQVRQTSDDINRQDSHILQQFSGDFRHEYQQSLQNIHEAFLQEQYVNLEEKERLGEEYMEVRKEKDDLEEQLMAAILQMDALEERIGYKYRHKKQQD